MKDPTTFNRRILIVDDNPAIHDDFRKILVADDPSTADIEAQAAAFFENSTPAVPGMTFELASAFQGEEGVAKVQQALDSHKPYAAAFVDMRMPPGWDGLETIRRIWLIDPNLEVIICTAYSDYSWQEIRQSVGNSDRLLILRKPFDKVEVQQLALALTEKWNLRRLAWAQMENLEGLVRQRTREIVRVNQSKSEFLTNVSHELLTPMNGILGNASLLAETSLNEDQKALVGDLQQSGERLLALIRQVLLFNSIESGKLKTRPGSFNIVTLCESVLAAHKLKAQEKRLALTLDAASDLPPEMIGDAQQLKQVLDALIDNAIKFSQSGSISVRVRISGAVPRAIELGVIDPGQGMDRNQIEALKHPFCQIDGGIARSTDGIGIGLTLVKQLLTLMGGQLDVQSTPGEGSTFSFTLPMAVPAEINADSVAADERISASFALS